MIKTLWYVIKIYLKGDSDVMKLAMLWASRIIDGANTYEEVPAKLRPYVKDILTEQGFETLLQNNS